MIEEQSCTEWKFKKLVPKRKKGENFARGQPFKRTFIDTNEGN